MRQAARLIEILIVAATLGGCGTNVGTDSLTNRSAARAVVADCRTKCHLPTSTISPDPLATNGSGGAGKHVLHVSQRRIDCDVCHDGYDGTPSHMNGLTDTDDPAVSLVLFDASNATARWVDDTGAGTGRCSSVTCHGTDTVDWYGTTAWVPSFGCETCHKAPAIDPVLLNGDGTEGKHRVHVDDRGVSCEACHEAYPARVTHANGQFETDDPGIPIVAFNGLNTAASWTGDNGAATGACANVVCHGSAPLEWYGTAGWTFPADCLTCHAAAAIDPALLNGTGAAGKHEKHVTEKGIACEKCHAGYELVPTHMNGALDTPDPAASLVLFDPTNPYGAWTNDTGPGTGSCADVTCHGVDAPEWYGTGGWTFPTDCLSCHASAIIDPQATNGTGDQGKHIRHVADRGIDCEKCHLGYTGTATHMNGTYGKNDPGATLVAFDAPNGSALWDAAAGTCNQSACHGSDTVEWYATTSWTLPACGTCHDAALGSRRQILGSGGDFEKPSHHVIDYANPAGEIVTEADCRICHNMNMHTAGTVHLNVDGGGSTVFDPQDLAGLESFCLGCHDNDGLGGNMAPFSDGNILGGVGGYNQAGSRIAAYWNGAGNTHGQQGLTCAGTGATGTGCHGNAGTINLHGSANRGLLSRNLTLPGPASSPTENDFRLCFDCHQNYAGVTKEVVFGYLLGGNYDWDSRLAWYDLPIGSLFRDRCTNCDNNPEYDDALVFGLPAHVSLHNYHLLAPSGFDSAWNYRGLEAGRPGCTTCHNVHGTAGTVRLTYENLGITAYTDGANEYKTPEPAGNYSDAFSGFPVSCNAGCHTGPTSYWHGPSDE